MSNEGLGRKVEGFYQEMRSTPMKPANRKSPSTHVDGFRVSRDLTVRNNCFNTFIADKIHLIINLRSE